MFAGNAAAQLIVFSSLPVVTRLFDPSVFGLFSSLAAIVMLLTVFGTLKLDLAVIVCSEREVSKLLTFSLGWSFVFSCLLYVFWPEFVDHSWYRYRIYVSVAVFMASTYMLLASLINRAANYVTLSFSKIVQALIIVLVQIGLGIYSPSVESLLLAYSISFALASVFLLIKEKNRYRNNISIDISYGLLKKYKNFIVYQTPANAINMLSQNVFLFLLLTFYGPIASGLYALSNRLLLAPSALIGKSTRDVFIQEASRLSNERDKLKEVYYQTTLKLLVIAIPLYSLAAILSYFLFGYVFGADWNDAGILFSALCIWGVGLFSNAPATATINVIGLQKFSLLYEIGSLLLRVFAVYIAYKVGFNYVYSTFVFSIFSLLVNLYYIYYVYKKI